MRFFKKIPNNEGEIYYIKEIHVHYNDILDIAKNTISISNNYSISPSSQYSYPIISSFSNSS